MIRYIIVLVVLIFIISVYTILYYRRFNKALTTRQVKLYKLTPSVFMLSLLIITLVVGFTSSITSVYALEKKVAELENIEITNIYLNEGFPNADFEYIYTYYNQFFGGGYSENGSMVVCIRDDSPQDLLDYLDDKNVSYTFVKNNFSDLLQLHQLIVDSRLDIDVNMIITNNEKENKVVIITSDVESITEMFQTYVDSGILEVSYGGEIQYLI
ncbi:MAG: hypothetical protein KKH01_09440 [Firmicutes bacterium]|nr:hypothetical protein [Bacillota bacterium]